MTHGRFDFPDRGLLLGLVCVLAMASPSCIFSPTRGPAGGNSGGVNGSGGISGNGGGAGNGGSAAGSSIGSSVGSAGGDTGLFSGGAGGGASGSVGTGGSTVPADGPCTGDAECAANRQFCEPATKLCSQCVKSADCPSGGHCFGNRCVTFTPCGSKTDCSTEPVCDTTRGVCVQCMAATDCAAGQACNANKCVALPVCKSNTDCASKLCDSANGVCIDCLVDSHCTGTNKRCVRNVCRPSCTSKADCSALGMVCDTSNTACVQCLVTTDCPASWYCLMSACVPDVCDSTQSACNGTSVASCGTAGDVFDNFTTCAAGKPCAVRGAAAGCGGVVIRDGGAADGPPPATRDAGGGTCSGGAMVDPCKAGIPKFTGTQTVDGIGSEFCGLPYFELTPQNAVKIINYNAVPPTQFETATARVAWDSAGFHAFVEVQDSSVQTVKMADAAQATNKSYQGDSVELFFSSSATVTGLTSSDSNTVHVVIPANGTAVSVKDTASSGTPTALPTTQYAQATTATGYAIEALIPWAGTAPSSAGAVRFDLAINSADKSFASVDKMRDGQLIYYIGTGSGTSSCQTADGTVPWCDDRIWCQTVVQ